MRQVFELNREKVEWTEMRIGTYGWLEKEEYLWVFLVNRNGLCRIDKKTGTGEVMAVCKKHGLWEKELFLTPLAVGSKVVLVPFWARVIGIYDGIDDVLEEVEIKVPELLFAKKFVPWAKFFNGIVYGSFVYLFGYNYPAILKLNIDSLQMEYLTDWIDEDLLASGVEHGFLAEGCVQAGHEVYLAVKGKNSVLKLNLLTDMIEIIPIECSADGFDAMVQCGDLLGFVSWGGEALKLVLWNPESEKITKFEIETDLKVDRKKRYWRLAFLDGRIYLMPVHDGDIYMVDIETGDAGIFHRLNDLVCEKSRGSKSCLILNVGSRSGKLVFQIGADFTIYEYDPLTGEIENYCFRIDDFENFKKYYGKLSENVVKEDDISLPFFLELNKEEWNIGYWGTYIPGKREEIGKNIYQTLERSVLES